MDRRKDAYINVTLGGENKTISCADAWDLTYNAINCNSTHQCLEIEKASGNDGSKSSLDTPFPGRQLRTSFTDDTKPSMRSWSGSPTAKPVTAITERDGIISFDFMGGGSESVKAHALAASDINETGFTARWETVAQASAGYYVTLYKVRRSLEAEAKSIDTSLGSLPAGWAVEGDAAYSGNTLTLGATAASSLTTPTLDLSKGATLTIRAAQSGASAATLKIYAGDELIEQYIPTSLSSDYDIEIEPCEATSLTFAVDRRKSVAIDHITLTQEKENIEMTRVMTIQEQGLSHRFDGLESDCEYAYSVGVSGYAGSDSDPEYVVLKVTTGIETTIGGDSAVEYFNLQGLPVANPRPGNIYIIRQGTNTQKIII